LALLLCIACGDEERSYDIDEERLESQSRIHHGKGLSESERLGLGAGAAHGHDPHSRPRTLRWDLPTGWKVLAPEQYRDANFTLERDPSVECYLTVMSGGGGGRALNVNRWRNQMNLAPLSSDEIAELPTVPMFDRDAALVELSGSFAGRGATVQENFGFRALFLELPGTTLTLKMTGPAAVVAEEKERFLSIARSFRLVQDVNASPDVPVSGSVPGGGPNAEIAAGMATGGSGFQWSVPAGWTQERDRRGRVVTLHPAGEPAIECYVSMMGGSGGGVELNVNRWLGQVGATELAPEEISKLPTIPMLGATGVLVESKGDFTGMAGATKQGAGLLGVVCVLRDRAVFVKLVGPAQKVAAEKDNFLALCRSLKHGTGGK
jgi:hypothetical protein